MTPESNVERMPGEWNIKYRYSMGDSAVKFFGALKERKLVGARCGQCDRVFVPPKGFCEFCFCEITGITEVGLEGTIEAATVVVAPFAGSPEVPYCVAFVTLDGATSAIGNYVRLPGPIGTESLPPEIEIGSRVKVVFGPSPNGRITDFWFEPVAEASV